MKKLLTVAVFAIFSASSAFSASLTPSIGISVNQAAFAGEGNEKNFAEDGTLKTVTEEYGAFTDTFASVFVELGLSDNFAIGIDYVPGAIDSPENKSKEGTLNGGNALDPGVTRVQVDFQDLATIYLKANVPFLGGTYVKAGYAEVDVVVNESTSSGNTYADTETSGMIAAIGYQKDIDSMGLAIRAEIMAHQFDDASTDNGVAASAGSSSNGGRNEILVESMWGARGIVSLVKSF